MKKNIITIYLVIGLIYALYAWMFGYTAHKSLAYNLGQGIIWPAVMFPAIGAFVKGLVLVAFVAFLLIS